jgi:peptide/nickel transport system permease protein
MPEFAHSETLAVAAFEAEPPPGRARALLSALFRRPSAWIAIIWIVFVVVLSAFASQLGLADPRDQELGNTFAVPSFEHLLGTDSLGRDIFSRIAHGGGELLLVALIPIGVSFALGIPLGMLAGYVGGSVDAVVAFVVNVLFSIPGIVVILAVAAVTSNDLTAMMLVIGVVGSGGVIRLVRASTVATKNLLYVDAARVAQLSRMRILLRHILPNVAAPLVVHAFLGYGGMFLILTALAFLSLGFDPEAPNWGTLTLEASRNIAQHPWLMVPIGVAIICTILAINTIGSTLLRALPTQEGGLDRIRPKGARWMNRLRAVATPDDVGSRSSDALLRLEGVSVSIPGVRGGAPLVEGVSIEVRRGETLALVGESGSGKTLTALATVRLLPREAMISAGYIDFDGVRISSLSERAFRAYRGRRIGFVSQEPLRALDPCYTVGSQLVEVLRHHHRLRRKAAQERAAALLRMVGIARVDDVLRSFPHQLSGGMAQRVAIALAISGEPDLIVADEPTTALDVTVQAEILDLLEELQQRLGLALILVTHDFGVVADMADVVAVMQSGRIVEVGSARQTLREPKAPYTVELLRAASYEITRRGAVETKRAVDG